MILAILKWLSPRDYVIGGLAVVVIYLATMWHVASTDLKKAKLVYENPQVKTVEKIVYRTGPVQIQTVVVETKDGTKTTTINEKHEATTTEVDNSTEKTIVPLAIALAPTRTDRYLFGVGLTDFSPRDVHNYSAFAGYGFKNRIDFMAGITQRDDKVSPMILVVARF